MFTREQLNVLIDNYRLQLNATDHIRQALNDIDPTNEITTLTGKVEADMVEVIDNFIEAETGLIGILSLYLYDWEVGVHYTPILVYDDLDLSVTLDDLYTFIIDMKGIKKEMEDDMAHKVKFRINPTTCEITTEYWENED